jgi:hypothetical protein
MSGLQIFVHRDGRQPIKKSPYKAVPIINGLPLKPINVVG